MKHLSPDTSQPAGASRPTDASQPADTSQPASHDFDSISPSAYALLLMKGLTPIPYARDAAERLPEIEPSAFETFSANADLIDLQKRTPGFWARALHFESRYFSVDQLLSDLAATNILELSSGFSFRGLALSRRRPVFYIDTDLPALIETKRRFIEALAAEPAGPATALPGSPSAAGQSEPSGHPGHYELQPLNALDTASFDALTHRFPPGALTIVNEGLLVYLDRVEKERLCENIRNVLRKRGGCWITGDIYLKNPNAGLFGERNDAFVKFLEQHNIEANKFNSFDDAREFFARMGFTVDREASLDFATLSTLPKLLAACNPEQLQRLAQTGRTRIHAVWRLTLK
jgi:O-methyltransferase involved in polyketide biosynthesis